MDIRSKYIIFQRITFGFIAIFLLLQNISITFAYDRQASVNYAERWALKRNPDYNDYENTGGDCTNFVSQCLIAGGLSLAPGPGKYGPRYINNETTYATIPKVPYLAQHLENRKDFGSKSIAYPNMDIPDVMKAGDVIIYGNNEHSAIIVNGTGNSSIVNYHTMTNRGGRGRVVKG